MSRPTPYSDQELKADGLERARLPRHIAVIMDGNGRWAQRRGLPRVEGHRCGVQTVRWIVAECAKLDLAQLTLYCFSHENWKRPQRELDLLMSLLEQFLVEERSEIMRQDLVFCSIGRRDGLSAGVLRQLDALTEASRGNGGMRLCLAINYGSRQELVDACRGVVAAVQRGELDLAKLDETQFEQHLYTAGMVDPDLLIRTAGERRISNFLLWQISYAELWVTDRHWPEFRRPDLLEALRDYAQRDRRFGGLKG